MKYLKLFEAKEELYSSISSAEFIATKDIEFSKKEENNISEFLKSMNVHIEYNFNRNHIPGSHGNFLRIYVKYEPVSRPNRNRKNVSVPTFIPTTAMKVYKASDDWFYVVDHYTDPSVDIRDIKHYKCDQLDGLLDCLDACINK